MRFQLLRIDAQCQELGAQLGQRIGRAPHMVDFRCFPIDGLVVRIGVVGQALHCHDTQRRPSRGAHRLNQRGERCETRSGIAAVHAVNRQAIERGRVAIGQRIEGLALRTAGNRVAVVLDQEQHGQAPADSLGDRLQHFALLRGAVAQCAKDDGLRRRILDFAGDANGLQRIVSDRSDQTQHVEAEGRSNARSFAGPTNGWRRCREGC
jgi:hypothetical protein